MLNEFGTINSNWVQQQQQMKMEKKKTHLTIFGRCLLLRFDLRFSFIHHKTSPIIESIRFFFGISLTSVKFFHSIETVLHF